MSGLLSGVRIVAKEDVKKDLKREKKERKKERKRERKRAKRDAGGGGGGARDDSASSDDGDDDDDGPNAAPRDAAAPAALDAPAADHGNPDDWMAAATGASKARDPRSSAQIAREAEAERQRVVASERELNPFWKDGGDGVKPDDADARGKNALLGAGQSGGVGDGGASWRLKALRRAKERAEEEGRSLHDVVGDRWGSVGALVESIGKGNKGVAHDRAHVHAKRERGGGGGARDDACFKCGAAGHFARDCPDGGAGAGAGAGTMKRPRGGGYDDADKAGNAGAGRSSSYLTEIGSGAGGRGRMRAPSDAGTTRIGRIGRIGGGNDKKDRGLREEDKRLLATASMAANTFQSDGSFFESAAKKAAEAAGIEPASRPAKPKAFGWTPGEATEGWGQPSGGGRAGPSGGGDDGGGGGTYLNEIVSEDDEDDVRGAPPAATERERERPPPPPPPPRRVAPPSREARDAARDNAGRAPTTANTSAAAALRARLMGKKPANAATANETNETNANATEESLPLVTADGRAAPGAFGRATTLAGGVHAAEGAVRKPSKTTQRYDTSEAGGDGRKARYYADDDAKSLADLVAAERHGAGESYDENLARNITRKGARYKALGTERERDNAVDDEYDNDAGLEMYESRDSKKSDAERQRRAKERAVREYQISQKRLSKCQYCLEAPDRPKHLHVAYGNLAYLMLPMSGRLVPGHCVIAPIGHVPSSRACDEDVFEEMRNFKKCLVRMFASQGKGCVFYETVTRLGGSGVVGAAASSHAFIECVPIPDARVDDASMYFKKAIDEAESEWSVHDAKKCISTAPPRGLRGAIPPNFPYFHVEFGMRGGYVHVIDDESRWRVDLPRDVLVGLLDLPENVSRAKRRPLAPPALKREMDAFLDAWDPVDWTKQLA